MEKSSAENTSNYTLISGLNISNAARDLSDSSIVHLTTASQTNGIADTLIVSAIADTVGNIMTTPDTVAFRQGITPISTVQDTFSDGDTSLLEGETVTITGIVTASFGSYNFYFLENSLGGPWSGILTYDSDHSPSVGDSLILAGVVEEYFYPCGGEGKTEITPVVYYSLEKTGSSLPDPEQVNTGDVSNNSPTAEMYESVLIKLTGVKVVDTLDVYNEWRVANIGYDSLVVGHHSSYSYIPSLGDSLNLTGPLNYAHCNYKIEPRDDDDIEIVDLGIKLSELPAVPASFSLSQNYPNPFNPVTQISFSLPDKAKVRLVVYNIVGQKVAELVNGKLDAGSYRVSWDAKGFTGGIYFGRLRAGASEDVIKMILLK